MRKIFGYLWGSREHGAGCLVTGELGKLNFGEHVKLFLGNKEETSNYCRKQGNVNSAPGRSSVLVVFAG